MRGLAWNATACPPMSTCSPPSRANSSSSSFQSGGRSIMLGSTRLLLRPQVSDRGEPRLGRHREPELQITLVHLREVSGNPERPCGTALGRARCGILAHRKSIPDRVSSESSTATRNRPSGPRRRAAAICARSASGDVSVGMVRSAPQRGTTAGCERRYNSFMIGALLTSGRHRLKRAGTGVRWSTIF